MSCQPLGGLVGSALRRAPGSSKPGPDCIASGAAWHAERQRIQEEAKRKRSEKAKVMSRNNCTIC